MMGGKRLIQWAGLAAAPPPVPPEGTAAHWKPQDVDLDPRNLRGLLLSGGGARAAYQAGVLRHILEITEEADGKVPFRISFGASRGASNLAALVALAAGFPAPSS